MPGITWTAKDYYGPLLAQYCEPLPAQGSALLPAKPMEVEVAPQRAERVAPQAAPQRAERAERVARAADIPPGVVRETPKDGDCLFHTVALWMQKHGMGQPHPLTLRDETANKLEEMLSNATGSGKSPAPSEKDRQDGDRLKRLITDSFAERNAGFGEQRDRLRELYISDVLKVASFLRRDDLPRVLHGIIQNLGEQLAKAYTQADEVSVIREVFDRMKTSLEPIKKDLDSIATFYADAAQEGLQMLTALSSQIEKTKDGFLLNVAEYWRMSFDEHRKEDFDRYIARTRVDSRFWGSYPEIEALRQLRKVNVVVTDVFNGVRRRLPGSERLFPDMEGSRGTIYINYVGGCHYNLYDVEAPEITLSDLLGGGAGARTSGAAGARAPS